MPSVQEQREYVKQLYPGPGWTRKVNNMPEDQVTAIYLREINKEKK